MNTSLTLLVSDLHLSRSRPETAALFERFLAGPARDAGTLYILGDLFDYWAGDDDLADPFNTRICSALAALSGTGTRILFMPGNRDFLTGGAFAAAIRATYLGDAVTATLGNVSTLLLHGDTLCTDDRAYMDFRAIARTPEWRADMLGRPLAERKAMLEALRRRSEAAKHGKEYDVMDANAEEIAEAFRRSGVTRMVHGHTHRQARHTQYVDGRECERWVLGDWHTTGNALAVDIDGCRWLTVGS